MKKSMLLLIIVFCWSCSEGNRQKNDTTGYSDWEVTTQTCTPREHPDILSLPSYYLTACFSFGSMAGMMGYNWREHALDLFDRKECLGQISLQREGKDAVPGQPVALLPLSADSIWIYDRTAFCRMDTAGQVKERFTSQNEVLLECNYAMHTAAMGWNGSELMYPVLLDDRVQIELYDVRNSRVKGHRMLDWPECNPDGSRNYADMKYPNVNFAGGKVVYNYAYDSHIHTLDLKSGERKSFPALSVYADEHLDEYTGGQGMDGWQKYGWENSHFCQVIYLPEQSVYVRPMLLGVDVDNSTDLRTVVDGRVLCLMWLDNQFRVLTEQQMASHRYFNFNGWCALPDCVLLYNDNALAEPHDSLSYDLVFARFIK